MSGSRKTLCTATGQGNVAVREDNNVGRRLAYIAVGGAPKKAHVARPSASAARLRLGDTTVRGDGFYHLLRPRETRPVAERQGAEASGNGRPERV